MPRKVRRLETAFGGYTLGKVLGEGGAGRVYEATNDAGEPFAVKVLAPERANADRRKRFKNEILFCERAQHDNIIRVIDHGVDTGGAETAPFYVMPQLDGSAKDVFSVVMEPAKRLRYFDQILSGVEAAHLKGVFHRDLKPENVLFDRRNDRLVIADFGIAHFQDEELFTAVETAPASRLANFMYAAPEQRSRGIVVDQRADIYALGLMLNEAFTGQVPHGAGYKTVGSIATDYAWVDEIVVGMLQQDPTKRPPSIAEIKRQFIAKRQDWVTMQRLSEVLGTVVAEGEEDDPLALEAPHLVEATWAKGELTLVLSRPVNTEWVRALIDSHSRSLWGKDPRTFTFVGATAKVGAEHSQVQNIIDYFKEWLPGVTQLYRSRREQNRRQVAQNERTRLERERSQLELERQVQSGIRL